MPERTKEGMRKVSAEEINNIDGLHKIYANPDRGKEAVLRVFHVQNANWATRFLFKKFNIDTQNTLVGTDFGKWMWRERGLSYHRRAGKPVLSGRSWKTQHDPWRGISRSEFGVDYLKAYPVRDSSTASASDTPEQDAKMMELNYFDDEDNPAYMYDIYVQRTAVYIQHKDSSPNLPMESDIRSPYDQMGKGNEYFSTVDSFDNENAIIIFENSHSRSIDDTMIAARQELESRWEDKIYEQPADESRAPELWTNSSQWLKIEKLMFIHIDVVRDMRNNLRDLIDEEEPESWLEESPGDFERLSNSLQEDLVKPTANLADLMYKSVGIRDSRHSLTLGTSMWRLSWITFIFLPLTFMVGFFGMNVDTFSENPSIKWYFITVVPFMFVILVLWYVLKHYLARQRQTPYQRGIYERLFHDLATAYPALWSRNGPRGYVQPISLVGRLKWRLIVYWAAPNKTIKAISGADAEDPDDGLGSWSRFKRSLMRSWTSELRVLEETSVESLLENGTESFDGQAKTDATKREAASTVKNVVSAGLGNVTELLALPAAAEVETRASGLLRLPPSRRGRRGSDGEASRASKARSSSAGRNSCVMVEEKEPTWLRTEQAGLRGRRWRRSGSGGSAGGSPKIRVQQVDRRQEEPPVISPRKKSPEGEALEG
ncbi:MAG: hypothetical protein M1829_006755 [Trizodia sp. TS-e1964]|nr:MAG: hypothetical protein M1829_006755 [Trizodia sp. TS-e1964]